MTVWFTSDTHFAHRNVIEFCKRPFASIEEMDEEIIRRWNERVEPGDRVYHLGDFAFGDHDPYLSRLNGMKKLVIGNHDGGRWRKATLWHSCERLAEVETNGVRFVLCHYAMRVWRNSHRGALHLYGHSHGSIQPDSSSLDVGVDCWDFRPISVGDVINRLKDAPARPRADYHGDPA